MLEIAVELDIFDLLGVAWIATALVPNANGYYDYLNQYFATKLTIIGMFFIYLQ